MTSRNFSALDRLQLSHLPPCWDFELEHQQRDDDGKDASAAGFQPGKAQFSLGKTPQESHTVHSSRLAQRPLCSVPCVQGMPLRSTLLPREKDGAEARLARLRAFQEVHPR